MCRSGSACFAFRPRAIFRGTLKLKIKNCFRPGARTNLSTKVKKFYRSMRIQSKAFFSFFIVLSALLIPLRGLSAPNAGTRWNYFRECRSDDTLYAAGGSYWYYENRTGPDRGGYVYGGKYRTVTTGVIELAGKGNLTYTHRSLSSAKCGRK